MRTVTIRLVVPEDKLDDVYAAVGKAVESHESDDDRKRDEPHVVIDGSRQSTAAATGEAVAHVLGRPDSIRQRAQNAATISSAVTAALVIAAVTQLSRDQEESWRHLTIGLVLAALALWIISVAGFVFVVTHRIRDPPRDNSYQELVNAYEHYSAKLRTSLRRAAVVSGLALVLTIAAVAAEVLEQANSTSRPMRLVLTKDGASAVTVLCGWKDSVAVRYAVVDAFVQTRELSRNVVKISVQAWPGNDKRARTDDEKCQAARRTVRLPRSAILAANTRAAE